jgi:hypothetical protein
MSTANLPGGQAPGGPSAQTQTMPAGGSSAPRPAAARRGKLTVARVDPRGGMKMSFLLCVGLGKARVVLMA